MPCGSSCRRSSSWRRWSGEAGSKTAALRLPGLFRGRQLGGPQVAKRKIRGRVVSLKAEVPGFRPQALARVLARRARVGPVGDLLAIDPCADVRAGCRDGHREPLEI